MKKTIHSILSLLVGGLLIFSSIDVSAQRNNTTSTNRTTSTGQHRTTGGSTTSNRNSGKQQTSSRPSGSGSQGNQQTSTGRPGGGGSNQGNGSGSRPGGNGGNNHNGGNGSTVRPGGNGNNQGNAGNRPNSGNRPNNNNHGTVKPGTGNNGGNHAGGTSAPRPGAGSQPGHYNPYPSSNHYRPTYAYRWERPLPPRPTNYNYVRVGVPSIGSILGLTFGTLIDYGINSLINTGYTVNSIYDNTIYLSNVTQYGVTWPEATIYYGPGGGMNGARFQYGSYGPSRYRFDTVYNTLCGIYGMPVGYNSDRNLITATWYGGNNTGYITLQYGPGLTQTGATMYYTDLIYGI